MYTYIDKDSTTLAVWISEFLKDRKQIVIVNDAKSKPSESLLDPFYFFYL